MTCVVNERKEIVMRSVGSGAWKKSIVMPRVGNKRMVIVTRCVGSRV